MGNLTKVYVDSSHRSGDSLCQAGAVFHDHIKNKEIKFSSEVFKADNNNDSEILGIYFVLKAIYEKYGITNFRVLNDSIVACSMLNNAKHISNETLGKFPVLCFVRDYFEECGITVNTEQINRGHAKIKIADKLSKKFRKEKKYE